MSGASGLGSLDGLVQKRDHVVRSAPLIQLPPPDPADVPEAAGEGAFLNAGALFVEPRINGVSEDVSIVPRRLENILDTLVEKLYLAFDTFSVA